MPQTAERIEYMMPEDKGSGLNHSDWSLPLNKSPGKGEGTVNFRKKGRE